MWHRVLIVALLVNISCASFIKEKPMRTNSIATNLINIGKIQIFDYQGSSLKELDLQENQDDIAYLEEHIKKKYNVSSAKSVTQGNDRPIQKNITLHFKQVSPSYKNTLRKAWLGLTFISLGLIPFRSNVNLYLEAVIENSAGEIIGVYKEKIEYVFWVHLFLLPYALQKNLHTETRMNYRNLLFDSFILKAQKDGAL